MSQRLAQGGWRRLRKHLAVPLFHNAYFLMLSTGFMSALGLPFWALAARLYSAKVVGLAAAAISAMSLVSGVGQLGMSDILTRYLPIAARRTRAMILSIYLGTGFVTVLLAALVAATSHLWSPPLAFLADDAGWFAVFIAAAFTWTIFTLEDNVMTALHETRWVPVENAVFAIAKLVLVVALAHSYRGAGIFLAWILPGMILVFPVNYAILSRFAPRRASTTAPAWKHVEMRRLIAGNYVGSLATIVWAFVVPIIVADERGAAAAAYFFVPWTLSMGLSLVAAHMSTSLGVETALAEDELALHARNALAAIMGIVVPAAVVIGVFAPQVLSLFGPGYERHGVWLLRLLMLATVPGAAASVALSIARLRHNGRLVGAAQAAGAVITIGASALLLPRIGLLAPGVAMLVGELVVSAILGRTLIGAFGGLRPTR